MIDRCLSRGLCTSVSAFVHQWRLVYIRGGLGYQAIWTNFASLSDMKFRSNFVSVDFCKELSFEFLQIFFVILSFLEYGNKDFLHKSKAIASLKLELRSYRGIFTLACIRTSSKVLLFQLTFLYTPGDSPSNSTLISE